MIFSVIALVTAIACSIITVRTLVSYSDLRRGTKILIALFVVLGWFAPLIIGGLGQLKFISDTVFAVISFCGFTLFGFVFSAFVYAHCPRHHMVRVVWHNQNYRLRQLDV